MMSLPWLRLTGHQRGEFLLATGVAKTIDFSLVRHGISNTGA